MINSTCKTLYPLSRKSISKGLLDVGNGHSIYYRVAKSKSSTPKNVVYVHGGPGSASADRHRCYFNSDIYRVIQFDQRGCGRSTPFGCLENNSLSEIVEDMEKLRKHLKLDKWIVYGGSWGALIALRYAQKYPKHVEALVIWSTFLGGKQEHFWTFSDSGAAIHYPDAYASLTQYISSGCLMKEYRGLLKTASDEKLLKYAKSWVMWEATIMDMNVSFFDSSEKLLHRFRMGMHFMLGDEEILNGKVFDGLQLIPKTLPVHILHGEHDLAVPPNTPYELKKSISHAKLYILSGSGHCLGPAWGNQPEWDHHLVNIADELISNI